MNKKPKSTNKKQKEEIDLEKIWAKVLAHPSKDYVDSGEYLRLKLERIPSRHEVLALVNLRGRISTSWTDMMDIDLHKKPNLVL